ncbi:hypothetical protein [Pseudobdellovibrio exovorus]|uniref:Ribbon-helix-helix protein CopG domain-containing protein n=1 Tax=Pseudobdellovibrio exovorus JSS TaxID=1184267 RepID=M4VEP9_9BACT|nr:hypothetical protein [Pseudobdellovibrio exovorus]AGH96496.1 hypothetical protein A11Q_2280 [Pseudobdellovibrio exovorus JSS]
MKKVKYGTVELSDESFDNDKALIRVSMMLPLTTIKALKKLSLTEKHSGKYQVLIRDILNEWVEKQKTVRKRA